MHRYPPFHALGVGCGCQLHLLPSSYHTLDPPETSLSCPSLCLYDALEIEPNDIQSERHESLKLELENWALSLQDVPDTPSMDQAQKGGL